MSFLCDIMSYLFYKFVVYMYNISLNSLFIIPKQYSLKVQLSKKYNFENRIIFLQDICYLDKKQFKFFLKHPIENGLLLFSET